MFWFAALWKKHRDGHVDERTNTVTRLEAIQEALRRFHFLCRFLVAFSIRIILYMTHVYKTDLTLPYNLETLVHCTAKFSTGTLIYPRCSI